MYLQEQSVKSTNFQHLGETCFSMVDVRVDLTEDFPEERTQSGSW